MTRFLSATMICPVILTAISYVIIERNFVTSKAQGVLKATDMLGCIPPRRSRSQSNEGVGTHVLVRLSDFGFGFSRNLSGVMYWNWRLPDRWDLLGVQYNLRYSMMYIFFFSTRIV